jgi:hypothetical protein
MGELTQKVVRDIEAAKTYEDIRDWIRMAGELIRKADQPDYGSYAEIEAETVSWTERYDLKEAALCALERNSDPAWTQSMLSVLSRTGDLDLKKLWIDSLKTHLNALKRANAIVYTALQALRESGEPIFEGGADSVCSIDMDRNVEEAQKVLEKHGIRIPW